MTIPIQKLVQFNDRSWESFKRRKHSKMLEKETHCDDDDDFNYILSPLMLMTLFNCQLASISVIKWTMKLQLINPER